MKWRTYLLPLFVLSVLLLFVAYPILSVLVRSVRVDEAFGLGNYISAATKPAFTRTIWSSLLVAAGAALVATTTGLILSLTVLKTRLPFRPLFAAAALFPLIMPGFVSTLAYIFLFGRNGLITYKLLGLTWDVYSWKSVLIIQSLDFTAISFLIISAGLMSVDDRIEDAARNLGASEWVVFGTVTLPLIRPAVLSAVLLVFLRSMADFGTPLILGGRFDTLASASYTQLVGTYNLEMASAFNVILLIFCLFVFLIYSRISTRSGRVYMLPERRNRKELDLSRPLKTFLWLVCVLFTTLTLMLLISVILAAFTKHLGADFSLTLEHFLIVPQRGWNSIKNSLVFASMTSFLMCFAGIAIAHLISRNEFIGKKLIDFLTTLPFAVPGTLMGVGYLIAFNRAPLLLTGTWTIVIALTVIRELPFGLRSGLVVLVQQDPAIENASRNLGASKITTFWHIVVPLARQALIVSALYAFVVTVQTVGAIIFVINPRNKVLAVDVFEAIYRGDIGDAAALSLVMLLLAAVGVLAVYGISRKGITRIWFHELGR